MNNNEPSIEVNELTKKFGHFTAVNRVSFEVEKGAILGFLGANGAGKTTVIKMLCGLLKPTSGEAWVSGFDVRNQSEKVKQNIGYMSQQFSLYNDLTVWENIRFYAGIYGLPRNTIRQRGIELLRQLGFEYLKDHRVAGLPLGWKQKLAFSLAGIHRPGIIFLDEPTSGVDPITRRQFWEMIYTTANQGITMFVTTHYMDEAEYCHIVSIMDAGEIKVLDTPENLRSNFSAKNMNEVFLNIIRR